MRLAKLLLLALTIFLASTGATSFAQPLSREPTLHTAEIIPVPHLPCL
jgi:hypothetical protein